MSLRAFLHIPKRTAKLILYSTLATIVIFLALTRTKVGRDGLRMQLEEQFNATFIGNIEISRLQGNLLNTLYAENITLFDQSGNPVGTIDAAILEPSWIELMRKTISMNRVTLVKPQLEITQEADSSLNIQGIFTRKDGRPPQLFFNSSDIRIIDGVVKALPLPVSISADSLNAPNEHRTFDKIQAQLNIETRSEAQLVDIQFANFELPKEDLVVQDLHGQVFVGKGRVELNDVYLESDATRLVLSASVNNVGSLSRSPSDSWIDIDIRDSVIDFNSVQRLLPDLPLQETIYLSARIKGSIDNLTVQTLQLAHDNLILDAGATIQGLPDSAQFTFDLANSAFSRDDLKEIAPQLDLSFFSNDHTLRFHTLYGKGAFQVNDSLEQQPFFGEVNFGFSSPGGSLEGNIDISKNQLDSLIYLYSIVQADTFNVSSVLEQPGISSSLNGTIFAEGSGKTLDALETDIRINLSPSIIEGRFVDTLDTYLYTDGRRIELEGTASSERTGTLILDGNLDLIDQNRPIEANLYVQDFDLNSIVQDDSLRTNLDGSVLLNLPRSSLDDLQGTIEIALDSSSITHGSITRPIEANQATISLVDLPSDTKQLSVKGDLGEVSVVGPLQKDIILPLSTLWLQTLGHNLTETIHKAPPTRADSLQLWATDDATIIETVNTLYFDQLVEKVEEHIDQDQLGDLSPIEIAFSIQEAKHIYPWFSNLPSFGTNLNGAFDINANVENLSISGQIQADSLVSERLGMENFRGSISFFADRTRPIEDQLTLNTTLQADSLHLIEQVFPQATIYASLQDHQGTLDILTKSTDRLGPQRLESSIELLPEKNIFSIEDLLLSIGNSFWTIDGPSSLDMYGQTLVIPSLTLESKSPEANILQRINLSGVLSPSPSDTAAIQIENIAIRPISQFLNMKVPLGGLLNGGLSFTTTNSQPELTGLIQVDRFSFDTRVIGNVSLASRYLPGTPDIGLRIEVSPVESFNQQEFLPDAALLATYEENELVIDGTFRLPRFNQNATRFIDAGDINLNVDMTRTDVFFFEYIFPHVLESTDGFLTGSGRIFGDFDYPIFDLDLLLQDGELYIPKFNLRYTNFEGPIRIDREGIKLDNATLKDVTGGQASITGGFLFNQYRFFSFDLEAKLNEILIMNQDNAQDLAFYGQIWGSGTLKLTGPTNDAFLFSQDAITKASSELFIPVTEEEFALDEGYIIFADSLGNIPEITSRTYRRNLLSRRPEGERRFVDGLDMDLNITVPTGSTIHLVFDPLLGDVINAVSSGRVQLQKKEGEFSTFGTLSVESGDYLFTAGDVFARRFLIERGGTISWDGNPINARLNIPASYKTRASTAGLPGNPFTENTLIPLIVRLDIDGRVSSPEVNLRLEADRSDRNYKGNYEGIEAFLNQSERTTDFATSVLLTNSFLLTTEASPNSGALTNSGEQIAFSSVSQLVSSQLNRFLNEAIPNADFNLGLQGESLDDPDVTYGVALYLLNERLVIRGQGIYQRDLAPNQAGLEGEFEVEVRLTPNVSVSVFLRQEGDVLAENELTRARGAGISYQTQFSSWGRFFDRLFGWVGKKKPKPDTEEPVAQAPNQDE